MKFRWIAIDAKGKRHTGVSDAESEREIVAQLRSQGLLPQTIKQQRSKLTLQRFPARISHAELTLFTRQLATLMAAALPLDEALAAIQQQKESKNFVTIISALRQEVLEGQSLSAAMQQYPRQFDTVYCTLVKAGEAVGQPGAVLERLADFNEARQRMRSKLMQALIYPSLLTTVAILVVVILLTAVVPKVAAQFIHLKHELPLTTRTLLAISDFLSAYGPWLLGLFIVGFSLFSYWLKREGKPGDLIKDSLKKAGLVATVQQGNVGELSISATNMKMESFMHWLTEVQLSYGLRVVELEFHANPQEADSITLTRLTIGVKRNG